MAIEPKRGADPADEEGPKLLCCSLPIGDYGGVVENATKPVPSGRLTDCLGTHRAVEVGGNTLGQGHLRPRRAQPARASEWLKIGHGPIPATELGRGQLEG